MSLCVTIRTRDGGILMAADTAVSTEIDGVRYRVPDLYDENKIVVLQDKSMVFCSGEIEKCGKLRSAMRNMQALDLDSLQRYARELFGQNTDDDSSGIVAAFPDGKLVGMLSAQNFTITPIPQNNRGLDYFAFGFRQDEAYKSFETHFANDELDGKTPEVLQLIGKVFLTFIARK